MLERKVWEKIVGAIVLVGVFLIVSLVGELSAKGRGGRGEISLRDVLRLGLVQHRAIEESYIKVGREKKELDAVKGGMYPQVTISNKVIYRKNKVRGVEEESKGDMNLSGVVSLEVPYIGSTFSFSGGIKVGRKYDEENNISKYYRVSYKQPLLKGLWSSFSRSKYRKAEIESVRYSIEREKVRQEVALELMTDWWSLWVYLEDVELAEKGLERERKVLAAGREQLEVGAVSEEVVEGLELKEKTAGIEKELKEEAFKKAKQELLDKIGWEVGVPEFKFKEESFFRGRGEVNPFFGGRGVKRQVNDFINNYELRLMGKNLEKNKYDLIEAKDALLVDIYVNVSYGESFYNTLSDVDEDFEVSLNFDLPFNRVREELRLKQVEEEKSLLSLGKRALIKEYRNRLKNNVRSLELINKRIRFNKEKIAYHKEKFNRGLNQLRLGRSNLLEVEEMEREFEVSEREVVQLFVERVNLWLEEAVILGVDFEKVKVVAD